MKHPAQYTDAFLPVFAKLLGGKRAVLDPFAGTGKLALVKNFGFEGEVWCNELEPEWVKTSAHKVDKWNVGDARDLSWAVGVDAICTSPTYGNRMADSHNAKDSSRRITYTHYIGRKLTDGNSGAMQWGEKYKNLHESVWNECWKILAEDGLMIVNISNHIRKGCEVDVVGWHEDCLKKVGFEFVDHVKIQTPRMKFGQNSEKRIAHESILVFKKKNGGNQAMPTYRVTIDRTVRFQLDIEAESRLDALRKVTDTAMVYDDQDLKETRVNNVQELVLNPPD